MPLVIPHSSLIPPPPAPLSSPPPPHTTQCLYIAASLTALTAFHAWPLAGTITSTFWQPELRGAVCRLYSYIQWLLLLPRGWAAAYGLVGEGGEGGACPPFAARLLPSWFQIVLGGVAPLAVAYAAEARAKAAFLRAQGLSAGTPGGGASAIACSLAAAGLIVALATHVAWFGTHISQ